MPPRKKSCNIKRKRGATSSSNNEDHEGQGLNCKFHHLPDALIKDILFRLCEKTILICRCVCKAWLSLTSDNLFAHLYRSISPSTSSIGILAGYKERGAKKFDFYHMEEEQGELKTWSIRFSLAKNLPNLIPHGSLISNSCNGFLCVSCGTSRAIYLCNPMLSEYIRIPPSHFASHLTTSLLRVVALGFSDRTNDYKVLTVTSIGNGMEAEVYTIGTCVWRSIGKAPFSVDMSSPASLANGAPHWLSVDYHDYRNIAIWSFDFVSEQFRALLTPSEDNGFKKSGKLSLGVQHGCLILSSCMSTSLEMWIMKEYGVQNSWTKIIVVAGIGRFYHSCQPLMCLNSGEILMIFRTENARRWQRQVVVRYVPAEKDLVDAGIFRPCNMFREIIAYSPCFVSLDDISKGEKVKRVRNSRKYRLLLAEGSTSHKSKKINSAHGGPAVGEVDHPKEEATEASTS